jgi:hypothetical protein
VKSGVSSRSRSSSSTNSLDRKSGEVDAGLTVELSAQCAVFPKRKKPPCGGFDEE